MIDKNLTNFKFSSILIQDYITVSVDKNSDKYALCSSNLLTHLFSSKHVATLTAIIHGQSTWTRSIVIKLNVINLWTTVVRKSIHFERINSSFLPLPFPVSHELAITILFEIGDSYPDNHPFPRVSLYRRKPFYRAFRFRIWNQPCRNTWPRSR